MSSNLEQPIDITSLQRLAEGMAGELLYDDVMRVLYATDASVYRAMPLAVAYPRSDSDIIQLIQFATEHETYLIPRAAGTSLAGQTVGEGIVVEQFQIFH